MSEEKKNTDYEAELEKLKKERDALNDQLKNGQELIAKWGQEMGKTREEVESTVKKLQEQQGAADDAVTKKELEKALDSLRESMAEFARKPSSGGSEDSLGDMVKRMPPEQRAAAKKVLAGLPEEQRQAVKSDPTEARKFLEAAAASPQSFDLDRLLGDDEEEHKTEGNPYAGLFGDASQNRTPGAVSRQGSRFAGSSREEAGAETRRLADGVIPGPSSLRPQK